MSTNQNKKFKHDYFMNLALQQAKINQGNTNENPSVGCVVTNNNSLVSVGYTSFGGRPHAEYNAINKLSKKNVNSSLYVTLEPCSHYGKTPPCVKKIIKKKIKEVFFSIKDSDSRSYDKSTKLLKISNIKVYEGNSFKKIKNFYKSYIQYKEKKLPFVTCKLAISKDLFTINKKNQWITNKFSRGRVHLMRSNHDCILTSSNTVLIDNPILNCRINGLQKNSPSRIILDNNLRISLKSNVIKDAIKYKTIIFYNKNNKKKIELLNKLSVKTYRVEINNKGNLNLKSALLKVHKLGFSRVFLESGITLANSFLKENLVNDLKIFKSNINLNKNGEGSIKNIKNLIKNKKFNIEKINLFDEKLFSYRIK